MSMRYPCLLLFCLWVVFSKAQFNVTALFYQPDCATNSVKINVNGNAPPYVFTWGNGWLGDSITGISPGVYVVNIRDSANKDTTFAFIFPAPPCKVKLETVFTPNGDNINDTWAISHIENYPDFSLKVYDRWGQTVHSQKKQYIPWNGNELGVNLPEATYYYVFFYVESDATKFEKGSITIVR